MMFMPPGVLQQGGAAPEVPAAASDLVATAVSSSQINLSWTDNSDDETAFRIERSPNGSTSWTEIDTVASDETEYSDTGLSPSTTYYYRVIAERGGSESSPSNTDDATTSALWTPAALSPALWFSAADSNYSGGTWEDLSANGWDFTQADSGARPTYNATGINGHPSLDFDGTDDRLTAPSGALGIFRNKAHAWAIAIYRHTADVGDVERDILAAVTAAGPHRFSFHTGSASTGDGNKPFVGGRRLDADSFHTSGGGIAALTDAQIAILCGYNNYTDRTATMFVNSVQASQGTSLWSGSGNTSDTDSLRARVGASALLTAGSFLKGRLGELVVGNTALSDANRNRLEGYMAHNYGLSSLLPSDHPYKDGPP